jgi:hypothetical protein
MQGAGWKHDVCGIGNISIVLTEQYFSDSLTPPSFIACFISLDLTKSQIILPGAGAGAGAGCRTDGCRCPRSALSLERDYAQTTDDRPPSLVYFSAISITFRACLSVFTAEGRKSKSQKPTLLFASVLTFLCLTLSWLFK